MKIRPFRHSRTILVHALATAAIAIVGQMPTAHAGDLAAFLERAERMSAANEKVEADVTLEDSAGNKSKAHLVIDTADGGTLVFEQPETGWKSESPLSWKDGKATPKAGAPQAKLGPDETLGATDLRPIDFFPFWKTDYSRAMTSDENTYEQTVSLYADTGRPYALYVITYDKTKLVPHMLKYYRDTFNNLVRIRTDKDWVMVGSRPRPAKMLIQDFQNRSMRVYTFDWKLAGASASAAAPQ